MPTRHKMEIEFADDDFDPRVENLIRNLKRLIRAGKISDVMIRGPDGIVFKSKHLGVSNPLRLVR